MAKFNLVKLQSYINHYQKDVKNFWKNEKYKWEAVKCFQDNWNIDSADFWKMLNLATSKHKNLLVSQKYFPLAMLRDFIGVDQERVRNMFRVLYDEDKDLIERIENYQKEAELLRNTDSKRWKNHYQDLRAISVLLWLRYPDKYYIYKNREFSRTLKSIESDFSMKDSSKPAFYLNFLQMMNDICGEITKNVELKQTIENLLQSTPGAYPDKKLHIATIDFVFYVGKRIYGTNKQIKEEKIKMFNSNKELLKEQFRTYLSNCVQSRRQSEDTFILKKSTVDSYVSFVEVDKLFDYAPEEWDNISSIFEVSSSIDIMNIYEKLNADDRFRKRDSEETSQYFRSNAIKHYYCFLKVRELFIKDTSILDRKSYVSSNVKDINNKYISYITAIKSKPFLILAGISGTGKSRIVRELARACWEEGSKEFEAQKPENFEIVQVKPNWHDSSELIGYVSRVSGSPVFVAGDFLKFVAKAWENVDVPYFLCLDEMNLAPVEQYFAEYLSVLESRKADDNGNIKTDPIMKSCVDDWYKTLVEELTDNPNLREQFQNEGITIPQNLIVVGTVNMDETTFSFSRKVLDRAMTIEMNDVNLYSGLDNRHEKIGKLEAGNLIGTSVEGVDVYNENQEVCDTVLEYLENINNELANTPFKVAYRTRNEFLLYVVNNLPYNKDDNGNEISQNEVIARALDEITSMKILSRIEGDEAKIDGLLNKLETTISERLKVISGKDYSGKKDDADKVYSVSLAKLQEMNKRLEGGYTSFWS